MAITKTTEEDKIEIVGEHKNIQVRTATVIKEDGVELTRSFHRHVVECVSTVKNDDDNHNETIILNVSLDVGSATLVNSQHTISISDDEKQLIITEIADPNGSGSSGKRFVEIFNSSDGVSLIFHSFNKALMVAAASADPPPIPLAIGKFFFMLILAPTSACTVSANKLVA